MENEISFWVNELEKQTEINKLQGKHLHNLLKELRFTIYSTDILEIILKYSKCTKFLDRIVQRKEIANKKKIYENLVACVMRFAIPKTENQEVFNKSIEWAKIQIEKLIQTSKRSIISISKMVIGMDNKHLILFSEEIISTKEKVSKEFLEFYQSINFEILTENSKKNLFKYYPDITKWILERYIFDYSENLFDFSFDYWISSIIEQPITWFLIKNYLEKKYLETKSFKYMNMLRNIFMMIQKHDNNLCKYFREDYKETILLLQKENNISCIIKHLKSFKRKEDFWFILYLFPKLTFYSLESFMKGNNIDIELFTYILKIDKDIFINYYKNPENSDSSPFIEFQINLMKNPKNIILQKDQFQNEKLIWIIYYFYTYPEKKNLFSNHPELLQVLEKLI